MNFRVNIQRRTISRGSGLPDSKMEPSRRLCTTSQAKSWTVIRMKTDWKRAFSFDE